MLAGAALGCHVTVAAPDGYSLPAPVLAEGRKLAAATGAQVLEVRDPHQAVRGANVIYTDTWTSMGQEEEAEQRARVFPPYQVNRQLVAEADREAIVMHCLPAHRGQEITDEVADGAQVGLFQQAENRLHAQKAILVKLLT